MTFTDDDLKRLKECLASKKVPYLVCHQDEYGEDNEIDAGALIARLEAAEECAQWLATEPTKGISVLILEMRNKGLNVWRKAAGK